MSNQIFVERIQSKKGTQEGVYVSDDYGSGVVWFENSASDDDLELIEQIQQSALNQNVTDILDSARESERGMMIDGVYYDYSELSHLL